MQYSIQYNWKMLTDGKGLLTLLCCLNYATTEKKTSALIEAINNLNFIPN